MRCEKWLGMSASYDWAPWTLVDYKIDIDIMVDASIMVKTVIMTL